MRMSRLWWQELMLKGLRWSTFNTIWSTPKHDREQRVAETECWIQNSLNSAFACMKHCKPWKGLESGVFGFPHAGQPTGPGLASMDLCWNNWQRNEAAGSEPKFIRCTRVCDLKESDQQLVAAQRDAGLSSFRAPSRGQLRKQNTKLKVSPRNRESKARSLSLKLTDSSPCFDLFWGSATRFLCGFGGGLLLIGSMGRTVYLPTFTLELMVNLGKICHSHGSYGYGTLWQMGHSPYQLVQDNIQGATKEFLPQSGVLTLGALDIRWGNSTGNPQESLGKPLGLQESWRDDFSNFFQLSFCMSSYVLPKIIRHFRWIREESERTT